MTIPSYDPRQVDALVMPAGHLPDFEGKPVLASCEHCAHLSDQSDGPEYGPSWYACEKPGKEHMNNLKGFPFKTPQKCCELNIAFCVDWKAEAKRMDDEQAICSYLSNGNCYSYGWKECESAVPVDEYTRECKKSLA